MAVPLLVTGGIHLDGFMDTTDARSSYGDMEKKLAILKDSHVGAFAVIGCSFYLILSAGAWSEIDANGILNVSAKDLKNGNSQSITITASSNLSEEDINDYIRTKESLDKAGAYGIQGYGALLVEEIQGDYFNIVGLPISRLSDLLKKYFNINLFMEGDVSE